MRLVPTEIIGVVRVELERVHDERGWFQPTFDAEVFARAGLEDAMRLSASSFNERSGTLRGLHLQRPPHGEAKLVRCTRGRIFDVAVDIDPASPTFRSWVGVELDADRDLALYLAPGIAHGFVTLTEGAEIHYTLSTGYSPEAAIGVRWDDPSLAIAWPVAPTVMSERDRCLPALDRLLAAEGLTPLDGR